ncbi:MAG: hypothetical protein COA53_06565 [Rhodobacteraceae bacterium]|nr:MAG: hypothetical protein COA53_06565 [Paracoccaceae bacterium]
MMANQNRKIIRELARRSVDSLQLSVLITKTREQRIDMVEAVLSQELHDLECEITSKNNGENDG